MTKRAWRQLTQTVPNADTPAQTAGLRAALIMMLNDEEYPDDEKEEQVVTTALSQAGWTEETRLTMVTLALRWAHNKPWVDTLRQAITRAGEQAQTARPPSQQRKQTMATVPRMYATDNEAEGMAENLIEDLELMNELHRQADVMRQETDDGKFPFATPPKKLADALHAAERGRVTLREYDALVQGSKKEPYTVTTFGCNCGHGEHAQSRWGCYHAVAVEMVRRAQQALLPDSAQAHLFTGPATVDERLAQRPQEAPGATITPEEEEWPMEDADVILEVPRGPEEGQGSPAVVTIPEESVQPTQGGWVAPPRKRPVIAAEHIQEIKGKRHVKFAGLVIAAQEDGLVSLTAEWILNETELSLARATAVFRDGRRYEDCGDATPSNVTPMVKPHFRRVALTRAKARCLRDAMGIAEASLEELAEEGEPVAVPDMTRPRTTPPKPTPRDEIRALLHQLGHQDPTQGEARRIINQETGYEFTEKNYSVIIPKLKAKVAAARN